MPVIVADSGPVIALSKLGALALLHSLYGEVWLTREVRDELLASGTQAFEGQAAIAAALGQWLIVQTHPDPDFAPTEAALDAGEYSSIRLCLQQPGSLLIMDDQAGRREAKTQQIAVVGVVGILMLAKQRGLIASLGSALRTLQSKGYFLSDALIVQAVQRVGE